MHIKNLKIGPFAFLSMKDEVRRKAAASYSAIRLILLGGQLEQEQAEKACEAMSYLNCLNILVVNQFLMVSHHFDGIIFLPS